jgi:predicted PolB exonuclease-like 3'-5' exonuclease
MTTLVVFDIEAVPDLVAARRLLGEAEGTPAAETRQRLGQRYARNGDDPRTAFLKVPIYQIVCVATLSARREDGGAWQVNQIGSRSVGEKTEAEVLLGFFKTLPLDARGVGPLLVTFGGNGFDLPLLRYRAFALGVPVPALHGGVRRDYWQRFGQDHMDLCDVLSGYGASPKPSLAEVAALAEIPVKIGGIDGSQVEAYVAAGKLSEVADYCLSDVLATYAVYLRFAMVRGDLSPAHYAASMDSLKATVKKHVERRPMLSAFTG